MPKAGGYGALVGGLPLTAVAQAGVEPAAEPEDRV